MKIKYRKKNFDLKKTKSIPPDNSVSLIAPPYFSNPRDIPIPYLQPLTPTQRAASKQEFPKILILIQTSQTTYKSIASNQLFSNS